MFSNKADKATAAKSAKAARVPPSLVSADMRINGDLKSAGEVQVDGTVIGDIECGRLLVGEDARVEGEITAKEAVIRGEISGLIKADSVELAKTARVIGDVWHDTLAIEAGAFLDGHCRRNEARKDSPLAKTLSGTEAVAPASAASAAGKVPEVRNTAVAGR